MQVKPRGQVVINKDHPNARGLRHYYVMNEGGGTTVRNYANGFAPGSLNNFANTPGVSGWCGSIHGCGLAFDGTDDYVGIADNTAMDWINSGSFSISFWIKSTNNHATYMCPFARGLVQTAATYGISIELSTSLVLAFFRNDGTTGASHQYSTSTIPSAANNFVHCVLVFDIDTLTHRHYANGVEYSVTYPQAAPQAGYVVYNATYDMGYNIGAMRRNVSDFYTTGIIDEMRFYDRALRLSDVQRLYTNPLADILRE